MIGESDAMLQTSRKKRPLDRSTEPVRDARLIIIATEGRKTEKQYFDHFRSRRVQVKVLPTDKNNHSSPQHVLERLESFEKSYDIAADDELWLMIDRDRWPEVNLKQVAKSALEKKYKLAVSNPCFEVWLLCHFQPLPPAAKNCDTIKTVLKTVLGGSYNKSRLDVSIFKDKVSVACHMARTADINPNFRWPKTVGTHVYKVVDSINKSNMP